MPSLLVLAKGRAGEVYNIGGDIELTNHALAERDPPAAPTGTGSGHVTNHKVQDHRYSLDYRKISDELGFAPQIRFEVGLAEVFQWYRENWAWWAPTAAEARGAALTNAVRSVPAARALSVHSH